ncbi:50S ribosomal protein L10 [Deinococcus psychrotolerans]|uniref:Large ribosomal subunit protein uL10 n=1 Tax=Deinococcus psychrotolerans TaxID=2489213 RepID=A0A3G8YKS9_9DEIO|nr:50S ribosomal protein L10 [Deinococcus psychrotolerans]AZI41686.1 50S ribosomal protein L10 [Deinococcus psychrotolerans]
MPNQRNQNILASLKASLEGVETFFVVDYQGLSAGQLGALRKQVVEKGGRIIVAKNSLINLALGETDFSDALKGPSAIVVAQDDAAGVAKALSDAAKANDKGIPTMKAGFLEGKRVDISVVARIASLGTKDQLYSELVGVLGAHQSNFVGLLEAYKAQLEEAAA